MRDSLDPAPFWEAHNDPSRPLDSHALLCAFVDCETAIRGQAQRTPQRPIFIKTRHDRLAVTLEYFVETLDRGSAEDLLYVPGDYIPEIYFSDEGVLPHRARWFSSECADDEKVDGRTPRRRRVAIRRSKRVQRRLEAEARAWEAAHPTPSVRVPELADVIVPARATHRTLITEVSEWCLAAGRPMDRDGLALIVSASCNQLSYDVDDSVWTRQRVHAPLRCDVQNWCARARCFYPDGVPEVLWIYLEFLAATDRLDPASQPLDRLKDALRCAGLGDDGLPRPDDEPAFRCECLRPYRGPTHCEVVAFGD